MFGEFRFKALQKKQAVKLIIVHLINTNLFFITLD